MTQSPAVETKNLILHTLASVDGASFTNQDLAGILSRPIIQVNRALNNIMQAKVPMVELADDGYRFIGDVVNLPGIDNVEDVNVNIGVEKNDEEADGAVADPRVMSSIARMFGKKRIMEEDAAIKTVGASSEDFNLAAIALEQLGAIKIVEMDDYEERVFRVTKKTPEFIDYHLQFEEPEVEEPEVKAQVEVKTIDVTETITRPVKPNASRVTAGDEANPEIDRLIIKFVSSEGKASESGTGRAVSKEIKGFGKVGRPRVMKRVLELAQEGKLTQFEDDAGVRFKIPGTEGVRIKTSENKAPVAKVKTKVVSEAEVVAPKKRGRPRKESIQEAKVIPEVKEAPVKAEKVKAKPVEKVAMQNVGSSDAMTVIRAMLEQNSGSSADALSAAFKEIFNHMEAQDAELVKWRAIGASMVNQISEI